MIRTIARLAFAALLGLSSGAATAQDFTSSFRLEDCEFRARGANPHFRLEPERQLVYEGEDAELFITVLEKTRRIPLRIGGRLRTIRTAVVEEREFHDGALEEISRNFFAICSKTNDVYYFGEEVDIYEDGEIVSHEGAWLAGRDGALPGILMPGTFLLGSRYFQEVAPGVALDRAEHVAEGLDVPTEAGTFRDCVEVRETTPLAPNAESTKVYCPGVGLVADDDLLLVEITKDD